MMEYFKNSSFKALKHYVKADKIALKRKRFFKSLIDPIGNYLLILRIFEYLKNTKNPFCWLLLPLFRISSRRLGFSIPINVFGPGLRILHYGTIVVTPKASIGKNCTINAMVQIGPGGEGSPKIGDNCYIGPGAIILGNIVIGDDVRIGANAVVTESFPKGNVTLIGIPAKPHRK